MVYSLRPHEHDPCKGSWAMVARSYDTAKASGPGEIVTDSGPRAGVKRRVFANGKEDWRRVTQDLKGV